MEIGLETKLTETVEPRDIIGRHRQKMNTGEVIRKFFENSQPVANSANCYLDRGVIYSYGRHWPLARWVRRLGSGSQPFSQEAKPFLMINVKKGSVTTSTKHRSPIMQHVAGHGWFMAPPLAFMVNDPLADTDRQHQVNYLLGLDEAEYFGGESMRGAKRLRPGKALLAIDHLMAGFHYANTVGLTGKPTYGIPPGALADWLEEGLPELVNLRRCAASLCPLTGKPL